MPKFATPKNDTTANLGFEARLWAADARRNNQRRKYGVPPTGNAHAALGAVA